MAPKASSTGNAEQWEMLHVMEQLSGLPKSSVVVRNVRSSALCNVGGVAQGLASLGLRPCGSMILPSGDTGRVDGGGPE
jgi:hypothetical protein